MITRALLVAWLTKHESTVFSEAMDGRICIRRILLLISSSTVVVTFTYEKRTILVDLSIRTLSVY